MTKSSLVLFLASLLLASCGKTASSSLSLESAASTAPSALSSESVVSAAKPVLMIPNVKQYLSYDPSEIQVYLDKKQVQDLPLYFEIMDETICSIANNQVTGLKVGKTTVYASESDGTETSFEVTVLSADDFRFNRDVQSREEGLTLHASGANPTLFIGDSFFDPMAFWTSFYDLFPSTENCIAMGISSSKSTDWMILKDRLIAKYQPKNLVIHIGTNDINDNPVLQGVESYYSTITSFLDAVRKVLPNTPFYYLGIEDRAGSAGGKNLYSEKVTALIKDTYAPKDPLFTYLDTPSVFNADQATYIRSDNIHPSQQGYAYYSTILHQCISF